MSNNQRRGRRADGYSVNLRSDGRWEARVTIGYNDKGNPIRKSFYGERRTDALEEAQRFKVKLDTGGFVPVTRDSTLGEWLDRWLESHIRPHREPKTTSYYEGFIRLHLKPTLGSVGLRKLTAQQIQHVMNEKIAEGRSAEFGRGLRATIRSALNQAWREGLVEHNVAARVTPPKLKPRATEFFDPAEVRTFLDACVGDALGPLFKFAVATGLRIGEATGLRWMDVDFERSLVSITHQLQRIDSTLTLKAVKSSSSRRVLPLTGLALEAIHEQRSWQLLDGFENPLGLVFLNDRGRPLDPKYVHVHLRAVCDRAGLRQLSFHKLRHTAASLMVAAGVDLYHVKQQLGHSQISLTANLYAHGVTDAQRMASDKLDQVLRSGRLSKNPGEEEETT